MQNLKIIRKAFLIGAPGGINSIYLRGVKNDLIKFKKILGSERGGGWYSDEIITLPSATLDNIAIIHAIAEEADYTLTYFSGHGYTDQQTSKRMLCFQDGSIADIYLLNGCLRQSLFADTCRTIMGGAIGAIPHTEEYFSFTGPDPELRRLFDEQICRSPNGKIIVYGVTTGQEAKDTMHGGVFTNSLLHVGSNMTTSSGYAASTIGDVIKYVPSVLRERGSVQQPCIYSDVQLSFPFAIAMPKAVRNVRESTRIISGLRSRQ